MNECVIKVNAKLNWSLDVTGIRADGYHLLDMVSQAVAISDTVRVERSDALRIHTDSAEAPPDESNIAFRAVRAFAGRYDTDDRFAVTIDKRIPVRAGMAGGSADAAAVLEALYRLNGITASLEEKRQLGLTLGADVPLMLGASPARIRGIGEDITCFDMVRDYDIVVIKPRTGASTAEIFAAFDGSRVQTRPDNDRLVQALQTGDIPSIACSAVNVLQPVTAGFIPEVAAGIEALNAAGAAAALMTGSGSAVYGVFHEKKTAIKAYSKLCTVHEAYLTHTCGSFIE